MNHKELYSPLITQALALIKLLDEEGIDSSSISEIHVDRRYGFTMFTTLSATQIDMGFSPFQGKCIYLRTLLNDLEKKNLTAQTIDLSHRKKAFVKITPHLPSIETFKKGGETQWGKMEI